MARDEVAREIVECLADAFERGEIDAILGMLAEDATFAKRAARGAVRLADRRLVAIRTAERQLATFGVGFPLAILQP